MKRAIFVALLCCAVCPAQDPVAGSNPVAQVPVRDPIGVLLEEMRAAEAKLTSVRLVMRTRAEQPGGLVMTARGTLHVLRGTQRSSHVSLEYEFAEGVKGRSESAATAEGIVIYHDDPAFGEVHVRIEPKVVVDLEWAGQVLQQADLPGMQDPRAETPLGSGLLALLRARFDLKLDARTDRAGERGHWLTGPRKAGLDPEDADLPVADRVELFVRTADHALLELREFQADKMLEELVVESLELGQPMPPKTFAVDGRGQRLRDVQHHLPLWEQIEQTLKQAEAKGGTTRPSRR